MFCLFKRSVDRRKQILAEDFFLGFLKGKISTKDFWEEYKKNTDYQEILKKDKMRWNKTYLLGDIKIRRYGKGPYDKDFKFNPDTLLEICDINKLEDVYNLYIVINRYFYNRKVDILCENKDVKKYLFLQKIVPCYIDIQDGDFLAEIYNSTAPSLSKMERIKQAKQKIKEMYRFDKLPPKWLQSPEWPKENGVPLVFSHQANEIGKSVYYFYSSKTNNKIVIEQFE